MTERDEPVPAAGAARPGDASDGAAPAGGSASRGAAAEDRSGHEPSPGGAGPSEGAPDSPAESGRPVEIGGQKGPEPTRYGDWEGRGRCTDF